MCVVNKIRPLSLNLAHWFSSCEFFFTARKLWVDAFVREKRVGVIGPVGQVIGIVGEGRARKWKVKFNNDDVMFLSARSLALATGPSTSSTLLHEETQLIPSLDNDDVGSEEGERSNEDGSDLAGSSDDEDDSMQSLSAAEDAPSEEEPSENRYYLLPRRVVTKDAMFPRFLFTMKIMVFFLVFLCC